MRVFFLGIVTRKTTKNPGCLRYAEGMDMNELFEKHDEVLADADIHSLVSGLIVIVSSWDGDSMTNEVRMVHAWLCDEIERRYPDIKPALNRYAEAPDGRSYGMVVIDALRRVGALD